jgi:hypothetical protein
MSLFLSQTIIMPPAVIGKCVFCCKDIWTHKPAAPYSALTPTKADLLVAFYHLGFPSATKPTAASMAAALEAGALIHTKCTIQLNQVAAHPALLAEYNLLRAARDPALPAAAAFQNPDRSTAALLDKFAAASDTHQYRAPPARACATPAACDAPTTQYRHTDATSTSSALPYVKNARHDPRTCIDAGALERAVPHASWPALSAYLRHRRLVDRDKITVLAGLLVVALTRVAFDARSVFEFFRTGVPALLVESRQPGGAYLCTGLAHAVQLVAPDANSLLYSSAPQSSVVAAAAAEVCASTCSLTRTIVTMTIISRRFSLHFSLNFLASAEI